MIAELHGVAPAALELDFISRINEYLTDRQFRTLTTNLQTEGVIDYLDGGEAPWDAYMQIMDGITFPYPDLGTVFDIENPPEQATLIVPTIEPARREPVRRLCSLVWAGIHGPTMPDVHEEGLRTLKIESLTYPDVSTLGRIGTALLTRQYGNVLGRNARLTVSHKIAELESSGVVKHLPHELRERITYLKDNLGDLAGSLFLSGGRISLLGMALRLVLGHSNLRVQRPKGYWPAVEWEAAFYLTATRGANGAPVSGLTIGRELADQAYGHVEDVRSSLKQKDFIGLGKAVWGVITEFRATEGLSAAARAIGTLAIATRSAARSSRIDKQTKKHLGINS